MTVLQKSAIVGANGFIGSALAKRLRSSGRSVAEYTRERQLLNGRGELDREARQCDVIYWLLSSCTPASAEQTPALASAELTHLKRTLDALEHCPRGPRVVFASSGGTVYSRSLKPPYSESSAIDADTVYSRLKVASERAVKNFKGESLVVRISNPYGPGQCARRGQGVIAHWCCEVKTGGSPVLLGSSATQRDYIYIDDLIAALQICGSVSMAKQHVVLNLGSGVPSSLALLADHFRAALSVEVIHRPARQFDAPSNWLDVGLARQFLAWNPTTTLNAGLSQTFAWWDLSEA